ncbi:phage SPO1 DNA polymerase-related protein [Thermosinus carboxydivorans Nor1]|uniref:Type-4 uracil-DNA glycosylase n=1 Tax=Thermosinus carboxydivorans Nor1 TaxID=401526 RepID=A1HLS9_9FIRM|nr:uracil-DNA glycosylase [Thermosinus carboxydivorans]EAX48784.1 phage SPO1 DNA polymerase-related protein [Thermosinus carboxydivorans Nor1]
MPVPDSMFQNHAELEAALLACNQCALCREGNRGPTSYNGTPDSPLMLVGEGPGGVEDEYGVPLVGPSGQLLDRALASVGITRDRIYTTNVVKCRPRGNRTPTVEEGQVCASRWLDAEITLVKPKIIIALGSVALKYLYEPNARITKDRGRWFMTKYGIPAIATYHPAYLLRLTGQDLVRAKWEVYYDLKAAVERLAELAPDYCLQSDPPPDLLAIYAKRRRERLDRGRARA